MASQPVICVFVMKSTEYKTYMCQWHFSDITCNFLVYLGLTCLLPDVENGVYTTGATFINYEATATTTCNTGYRAMGGVTTVTCQANRTTTPVIVCEGNDWNFWNIIQYLWLLWIVFKNNITRGLWRWTKWCTVLTKTHIFLYIYIKVDWLMIISSQIST